MKLYFNEGNQNRLNNKLKRTDTSLWIVPFLTIKKYFHRIFYNGWKHNMICAHKSCFKFWSQKIISNFVEPLPLKLNRSNGSKNK